MAGWEIPWKFSVCVCFLYGEIILLKMAIYSGFSHEQWWFSIAMLVYGEIIYDILWLWIFQQAMFDMFADQRIILARTPCEYVWIKCVVCQR